MNKTTVDIAEYVAKKFGPCSLEKARKIQSYMEETGMDFSECSRKKFHRAIEEAYKGIPNL
jgi:hypothetical protein